MISKFSLSGKPKKALCGIFCGKSISEFINSCNLDKRDFVCKKGVLGFHFLNYKKNINMKKQF